MNIEQGDGGPHICVDLGTGFPILYSHGDPIHIDRGPQTYVGVPVFTISMGMGGPHICVHLGMGSPYLCTFGDGVPKSLWLFLSLFPLLTPPLLLPFTFLHLLSLPIHYPSPYRSAQITVVMPTHANWLLGPSAVQGLAATAPVSSGPMVPHAELRLVSVT